MTVLPKNVDETSDLLRKGNYLANRSLSTALYLSMSLGKPLFLEGEAGVGCWCNFLKIFESFCTQARVNFWKSFSCPTSLPIISHVVIMSQNISDVVLLFPTGLHLLVSGWLNLWSGKSKIFWFCSTTGTWNLQEEKIKIVVTQPPVKDKTEREAEREQAREERMA